MLDPVGHLIDEGIPAWMSGYTAAESAQLSAIASEIAPLPAEQLNMSLEQYTKVFSGSAEEVSAMSKVYLLLRVLYHLPTQADRERVKVYGGWVHPSIGSPETGFNLSWPVATSGLGTSAKIHVSGAFDGYLGRGYDASGELKYFNDNFPKRVF